MRFFLIGTAAAIAVIPASAGAQVAPAGAPDAASSTTPFDEIVVTARKRSESLVDVPISVTAISGDNLDRAAIRDVASAAGLVPNLYVDKVAAGPRVSIRGLGNSQTGGVVDSSVGLGIDGIFFGRPRWLTVGLFDVLSIEVLRGPQSTYYGKNTTAGLINIRTRNPGEQLEGYVLGGYEAEIGGYNVEGAVGGPLSDTFGVRAAYRHSESDGFLKLISSGRDTPRNNEEVARITFDWNPVSGLSANYKLTYFNGHESGNGQEVGACSAAFRAQLLAAGSPEDCVLNYQKGPEAPIAGGILPRNFYTDNKGWSHALNINAEMGDLTLSSVTGYNRLETDWSADGDWSTLSFFNIDRPEQYKQFSQELRLQSSTSAPISFVVGAYFDDASRRMNQNVDAPAFGISFVRQLRVKAQSYAAFGEVTGRVTPELTIVVGGRYTDVRQRGRLVQDGGLLGNLAANYPGSDYDFQQRLNKDNFSPSATIQYQLASRAKIYASYKRGFKAGGFDLDKNDGVSTFNYNDEKAESYEIGAKAEVLERRLLLSGSLFQTNVSGLQVQSYIGTGPTAIILNAASARLRGIEGEARLRFSREFTANINVGYTDAKYRSFPSAPCTTGEITAGRCTGTPATQDLSGGRLPLAPKFNFSAGLDYRAPVHSGYDLAVSANVTHRSSVFLSIENDPLASSGALTLADGRIAIEPSAGDAGFTAAIVARNIFDKKYVTGAIALPSADSWAYQVGVPRTIEFQLGYRF